MTIQEAAQKWGYSANWVRELVKVGKVAATFRTDVPVPFWDIPDAAQPPTRTTSVASGTIRAPAPKARKRKTAD